MNATCSYKGHLLFTHLFLRLVLDFHFLLSFLLSLLFFFQTYSACASGSLSHFSPRLLPWCPLLRSLCTFRSSECIWVLTRIPLSLRLQGAAAQAHHQAQADHHLRQAETHLGHAETHSNHANTATAKFVQIIWRRIVC